MFFYNIVPFLTYLFNVHSNCICVQCKAGHVVCSLCHRKLKATGSCHMCGGVANSSYRRSRAMERVVEAIRVQCPNAGRGCTTRPAYYDQERHRRTCLHAPCCCPCVDCNFIGSTKALLDHFDDFHGWPCFAKVRTGQMCNLYLKNGLNTIILPDEKQGTTAHRLCLFLLDVVRQPLGCTIFVLLIHPHAEDEHQGSCSMKMKCELTYSWNLSLSCGDQVEHSQESKFTVTCTDQSSGLPNRDEHFQFVVPNSVLADDDKENAIKVGFRVANN